MGRHVHLYCIVFVLTVSVERGVFAQQSAPDNGVPASYIQALNVANQFLEDWVTGNFSAASALFSMRLRREIKDQSWFRLYMQGLSNPHHMAFEINGGQPEKADRYSFHVVLYELATAAQSGDSYGSKVDLVKQGNEWKIDVLPKSSDNQD